MRKKIGTRQTDIENEPLRYGNEKPRNPATFALQLDAPVRRRLVKTGEDALAWAVTALLCLCARIEYEEQLCFDISSRRSDDADRAWRLRFSLQPADTPLSLVCCLAHQFNARDETPALSSPPASRIEWLSLDKAMFEKMPADLITIEDALNDAPEPGLHLSASTLSKALADFCREHYQEFLCAILERPLVCIGNISFLPRLQRLAIIKAANPPQTAPPVERTLDEMFMLQAQRTPDTAALEFEGVAISYRELDRCSSLVRDRLLEAAHHAPGERLEADTLVALCIERGPDWLISLLGVLKAGGAYLPLDPAYPEQRLRYMLDNSQAAQIIGAPEHIQRLAPVQSKGKPICESLEIRNTASAHVQGKKTAAAVASEIGARLAYIIYTSGSTGRPKAVAVEHAGVCTLAHSIRTEFGLVPGDRMLQFSSPSFDASVFEWAGALSAGATLVIASPGELPPNADVADTLHRRHINITLLPPSVLRTMRRRELPALKILVCGGEPCTRDIVAAWSPGRQFVNAYGPTEATVISTLARLTGDRPPHIGMATAGKKIFVLNRWLEQVPPGAVGELCIGGAGIARGYLNKPEASAKSFVDMPASLQTQDAADTPQRLYRTGDLVRLLEDGNLDYIGRRDKQIKIRGYRVELGEIEAVLCESPSVLDAAVLLHKEGSTMRLFAFCVPQDVSAPQAGFLVTLADHLHSRLPAYMVPHDIRLIEDLPMSPNGKVDRERLRAQIRPRTEPAADGGQTLTEAERILEKIWQQIFGHRDFGIDQSFYALGGDSIQAIQMMIQAKEQGLLLQPRDLIANPSIRALATVAKTAGESSSAIEDLPVDEPFGLAPIQHWFFEQASGAQRAFSQFQVIRMHDVDENRLHKALCLMVQRHDAFRLRFPLISGKRCRVYRQRAYGPELWRESLSVAHDPEREAARIYATWQGRFDFEAGETICTGLVEGHPDGWIRLFIAIHHLIVDGVSWRILIQDLHALYHQRPCAKTGAPLHQFQSALERYCQQQQTQAQLAYWLQAKRIPASFSFPGVGGDPESPPPVMAHWRKAFHVNELLLNPAAALDSSMQRSEILLSAFALTLSRFSHSRQVAFQTEGHGREPVLEIDSGNSVGWYTALFPIVINLPDTDDAASILKQVAAQWRSLPDHGLSYGVLRYLHPFEAVRSALSGADCPIMFNYLGSFSNAHAGEQDWIYFDHDSGQDAYEDYPGHCVFELNCSIVDDQFICRISYADTLFSQADAKWFTTGFIEAVRTMTVAAREQPGQAETLPDSDLETEQLTWGGITAKTADKGRLLRAFPLTPAQEGILFYDRLAPRQDNYFVQTIWRYEFVPDRSRMQLAWEKLAEQVDAFRTLYIWDDAERPRQCVLDRSGFMFSWTDLSHLSDAGQDRAIEKMIQKDREQPFNLGEPGAIRAHWVVRGPAASELLLSHHHILLDGWSLSLLLGLARRLYENPQADLKPAVNGFEVFVRHLHAQDMRNARHYFSSQLKEGHCHTLLPVQQGRLVALDALKPVRRQDEFLTHFSARETAALKLTAQDEGVTLSALSLFGTGVMLSAYNHRSDTLFGTTLGGRNHAVDALVDMIGMMVSTLPVVFRPDWTLEVRQGLYAMHRTLASLNDYSLFPLREIVEPTSGMPVRFPCIVGFENYPGQDGTGYDGHQARLVREIEKTGYPLTIVFRPNHGKLDLRLVYDAEVFIRDDIMGIAGDLRHIILQITRDRSRPASVLSSTIIKRLGNAARSRGEPSAPGNVELPKRQSYAQPRDQARHTQENVLLNAWCKVLNQSGIGLDDNFFALGGDSLNALQVAAEVEKQGYHLSASDLLKYPTITQCIHWLEPLERAIAESGGQAAAAMHPTAPDQAAYPLGPAQLRFLRRGLHNPHHFVIPHIGEIKAPVTADQLSRAVDAALDNQGAHHIRFVRGDGREPVRQVFHRWMPRHYFEHVDLAGTEPQHHAARVRCHANQLCRNLDIWSGPLFRIVFFENFGVQNHSILVAIFHHLVFDGFSLELFLERVRLHCLTGEAGDEADHEPARTSYRHWADSIHRYSLNTDLQQARRQWEQRLRMPENVPRARESGAQPTHRQMLTRKEKILNRPEQLARLQKLSASLQTTLFVLLLAVFIRALRQSQLPDAYLSVMGAQREQLPPGADTDLSRTMGYFSAAVPIAASLHDPAWDSEELKPLIHSVGVRLQETARLSLDYLVLQYVLPETLPGGACLPEESGILFHFLKQDPRRRDDDFYAPADLSFGPSCAPANESNYLLNVTAIQKGSSLDCTFYHSSRHYPSAAVATLARRFAQELETLLEICGESQNDDL